MRRISHGHNQEETVHESETAADIDHPSAEGGWRDGARRAGLPVANELRLRHAHATAQP